MDEQEGEAFIIELGGRSAVLDLGGDKNVGDVLDDTGVPAYEAMRPAAVSV